MGLIKTRQLTTVPVENHSNLVEAISCLKNDDPKVNLPISSYHLIIDFITIHYLRMMVCVFEGEGGVWWMGFMILGSSHIQILA